MKKLLCLLLAIIMSMSLFACTENPSDNGSDNSGNNNPPANGGTVNPPDNQEGDGNSDDELSKYEWFEFYKSRWENVIQTSFDAAESKHDKAELYSLYSIADQATAEYFGYDGMDVDILSNAESRITKTVNYLRQRDIGISDRVNDIATYTGDIDGEYFEIEGTSILPYSSGLSGLTVKSESQVLQFKIVYDSVTLNWVSEQPDDNTVTGRTASVWCQAFGDDNQNSGYMGVIIKKGNKNVGYYVANALFTVSRAIIFDGQDEITDDQIITLMEKTINGEDGEKQERISYRRCKEIRQHSFTEQRPEQSGRGFYIDIVRTQQIGDAQALEIMTTKQAYPETGVVFEIYSDVPFLCNGESVTNATVSNENTIEWTELTNGGNLGVVVWVDGELVGFTAISLEILQGVGNTGKTLYMNELTCGTVSCSGSVETNCKPDANMFRKMIEYYFNRTAY